MCAVRGKYSWRKPGSISQRCTFNLLLDLCRFVFVSGICNVFGFLLHWTSFFGEYAESVNLFHIHLASWTIYLCRIQWKTSLWYTFMWLDYNFSAAWFENVSPSCTHRWTMQKSTPYDKLYMCGAENSLLIYASPNNWITGQLGHHGASNHSICFCMFDDRNLSFSLSLRAMGRCALMLIMWMIICCVYFVVVRIVWVILD